MHDGQTRMYQTARTFKHATLLNDSQANSLDQACITCYKMLYSVIKYSSESAWREISQIATCFHLSVLKHVTDGLFHISVRVLVENLNTSYVAFSM